MSFSVSRFCGNGSALQRLRRRPSRQDHNPRGARDASSRARTLRRAACNPKRPRCGSGRAASGSGFRSSDARLHESDNSLYFQGFETETSSVTSLRAGADRRAARLGPAAATGAPLRGLPMPRVRRRRGARCVRDRRRARERSAQGAPGRGSACAFRREWASGRCRLRAARSGSGKRSPRPGVVGAFEKGDAISLERQVRWRGRDPFFVITRAMA